MGLSSGTPKSHTLPWLRRLGARGQSCGRLREACLYVGLSLYGRNPRTAFLAVFPIPPHLR